MIRKALIHDVTPIHALLQFYSEKGDLLGRPLSNLYDHLRDFWVYEDDDTGMITGCAALAFCWEDIAEIRRSLGEQEGEIKDKKDHYCPVVEF